MPIANVELSNTFNQFRTTTNDVIQQVNKLSDGTGTLTIDSITANTFVGVSSDLSISANSGTDTVSLVTETLRIVGTNGISTSVVSSSNTINVDLGTSGVTAGTYGSGSLIPQVVVNAQGRVTSVTNVNFSTSGVSAGTYGSASQVPQLVVDTYGRVTSASNVNVAGVTAATYTQANTTITISTADGGAYHANLLATSGNTASNLVLRNSGGGVGVSYFSETVNVVTLNGGNTALDWNSGSVWKITLAANSTVNFTNPPANNISRTVVLYVTNSGASQKALTVTGARYTDGVAPVLSNGAGAVDAMTFTTIDGGLNYYGSFVLANLS